MVKRQGVPMPILSIIIPTLNRATVLHDALQSLITACDGCERDIECLVVDNGSTDNTRAIVDAVATSAPFSVRYVFEPCPGVHAARNLGAVSAHGEILVYLEDDVFVQPGWANALLERFSSDPDIMVVGGPCLPHFEATPPNWARSLQVPLPDNGWFIVGWSLIYQGDTPKPVSGNYIFGGNFGIRRQFFLDSGGFHPEGMPSHLLHFRGDGETGMGMLVEAHPKYKLFYDPKIVILHRVPVTRMTKEHLIGIARRAGISNAYSIYRKSNGSVKDILLQLLRLTRKHLKCKRKTIKYKLKKLLQAPAVDESPISAVTLDAISVWQTYRHYIRICLSPVLRTWVTQYSYLPGTPCPYYTMHTSDSGVIPPAELTASEGPLK